MPVRVSVEIEKPREEVWRCFDRERRSIWDSSFVSERQIEGAPDTVGSKSIGTFRSGKHTWEVEAVVRECTPGLHNRTASKRCDAPGEPTIVVDMRSVDLDHQQCRLDLQVWFEHERPGWRTWLYELWMYRVAWLGLKSWLLAVKRYAEHPPEDRPPIHVDGPTW